MECYSEARELSKLAEETEDPGRPLQLSLGMPQERRPVGTEMAVLGVVTSEVHSVFQARRSCSQMQSQGGTLLIPSSLREPSYQKQVFLVLPGQVAERGGGKTCLPHL